MTFRHALRSAIRAGLPPTEAMREVWHGVRAGQVARPRRNLTRHKARQILHEGRACGRALSPAQRGYFGARASGAPVRNAVRTVDMLEDGQLIVRHSFYGSTAGPAFAIEQAHRRADRSLDAALRRKPYRGVRITARRISPRNSNPWHTYAGGTSAHHGYSYDNTGPWGHYTIDPPRLGSRFRGYRLMWANTKGAPAPHSGLWHELGRFRSPQAAKGAAKRHAAEIGYRLNPLTRQETGKVMVAARGALRLARRGVHPGLVAPEAKDPATRIAARAYEFGRGDAFMGVVRGFGTRKRMRGRFRSRFSPSDRWGHFGRALGRNAPVTIYPHVLSIVADKGRNVDGHRIFQHDFTSRPRMLGLPNGDLLITGRA